MIRNKYYIASINENILVILSVYDDMVIYICCKNMNNQNPIKSGWKILRNTLNLLEEKLTIREVKIRHWSKKQCKKCRVSAKRVSI
jgi:hypothetical protein